MDRFATANYQGMNVEFPQGRPLPCLSTSSLPRFELAIDSEQYDHAFELDPRLVATLSRRHVFLLDTSIWIRLADRNDELAAQIADKLIRLKNAEKIICPLAPPTIWELRKQTGASLTRMAKLMEELSENVTFRSHEQIFDREIESFLSYLITGIFTPLSLNQRFGPLLSYLAPGYRLTKAEVSLTQQGNAHLHQSVSSMRLTTLVKWLGDKSCPPLSSKYDPLTVHRQRRELAGKSVDLARRIEIECVAREHVLPRLKKMQADMEISERLRTTAKIDALPKSRRYGSAIEHLLRFTPALAALVEVHTISGLDITRKNSLNDFFDRELMIYALAYSGSFAAIDRWISNLVALSRQGRYSSFYEFANSLETLNSLLDRHS